jgi:diguanylate cyclase (GGDEF)-like protein
MVRKPAVAFRPAQGLSMRMWGGWSLPPPTMRILRPKIAAKFFLPLLVSIPLVAGLAAVGVHGLSAMDNQANLLYEDNTTTLVVTADLGTELGYAQARALGLLLATRTPTRQALARQIDEQVAPAIQHDVDRLRVLHAGDPAPERVHLRLFEARLGGLRTLYNIVRRYGALGTTVSRVHAAALAQRVSRSLSPLVLATDRLETVELAKAREAHAASTERYHEGRTWILVIGLLSLLGGLGAARLLTRSVVPRVRAYSAFAGRVATGDMSERVAPRGHDELTDLGHALNLMVDRRAEAEAHDKAQDEFSETMQVTETEDEAHDLLKRHVQRSVSGSSVVVLNRNNSADRLEARTAVADGSDLAVALQFAKPRSCLAVRFGRGHSEEGGAEPLVSCEVCGKTARRATCQPLLVGGEVIGSVLVAHPDPLLVPESDAIRESVTQAAPVLANLRNLAIAEMRASTDSLTGLPNNRAVRDTIKRMVAHASRTLSPLAAVLLDLDHFKLINDTHGHGCGDDVLAAVGAVLQSCVRASDFVGRQGGEEFLILMPDTGADGAVAASEKIRVAIAALSVPGVERPITASLGVAILPMHAGEAASLLRCADRALYTAKENGRNRVELAPIPASEASGFPDARPNGVFPLA